MQPPARHPRFPVIVGPTAAGKSALAVEAALRLSGEVVSADAFQVYRGMDVGTGKLTPVERRGVPHHLIDIRDPAEAFNADQWLRLAEAAIADIRARGRTPVVVGGTHFYVRALLEGLFEGPGPDPALRASLQALPAAERRAQLERVDPAAAVRIHPNDIRRTLRALEVHQQTGRPISEHQMQWDRGTRSDAVVVVLDWPASELNRRINARVRAMIEAGLVLEARGLWKDSRLGPQAAQALGYKQLIRHFEGARSLEDAVEAIKIETRRFAKNQRTWLRRLSAAASLGKESDTSTGGVKAGGMIHIDGPSTVLIEASQTIAQQVLERG